MIHFYGYVHVEYNFCQILTAVSVSGSASICVPGSFCLDVLHFCSVDVTSNLSHQLLCFIMLSYCSYFIIVYNYIYLISCLFSLTFLLQEEEKKKTKKNSVFFDQYFTQNTYTTVYSISNNSKQHKYKLYNTTMNRHNVLFINKHCCN